MYILMMLLKEIMLKNDSELINLVEVISSSIGSLSNPKKISDTFKSTANINIDPKTINSYLKYLEEAFYHWEN